MSKLSIVLLFPATALVGLFTACATTSEQASAERHLLFGRYPEAIRLAEATSEAWGDEVVADAQVGMLLEKGRKTLFDGQPSEALTIFQQADQLRPGVKITGQWIEKAERAIVESLLNDALQFIDRDDLQAAQSSYSTALLLDPENEFAENGFARTQRYLAHRASESEKYFREGLYNARLGDLMRARRELSIAIKHDPSNQKAKERIVDVDAELVEFYVARAAGLVEEGHWAAAQLELRQARLLDPDDPAIEAEASRVEAEVAATRLIGEASMRVRRKDFTGAEELLAEAEGLSSLQADAISLGRADIEDGRFEDMYLEARGFERDYRHEDALAAYEELLTKTEFYKDAIARRDVLKDSIEEAGKLYAAAQDAEGEELLSLLRQIDLLLPEYEDVPARLAALDPESN